jgi:hypothetical protein
VLFPDCNDFDNEEPTGDRLAEHEDRNEARAIFRNAWESAHTVRTSFIIFRHRTYYTRRPDRLLIARAIRPAL